MVSATSNAIVADDKNINPRFVSSGSNLRRLSEVVSKCQEVTHVACMVPWYVVTHGS